MKNLILSILTACFIIHTASADITVFAAASLAEALAEAGAAYGETPHFNFASSGTLARQIEAGAPADLFIAASAEWMDYLAEKSAIAKETRFDLAANTLVMVAAPGARVAFDGTIEGRIAVGDFKSVPAGMYAEEALRNMGWLDALRPKLVMSDNVRTALMYAERGEVAAAIVYATDAQASGKVVVVGTFPPGSHRPIVYPAAACSTNEAALRFLEFLKSDQAKAILKKHGFQ